jgi:histone H1/5
MSPKSFSHSLSFCIQHSAASIAPIPSASDPSSTLNNDNDANTSNESTPTGKSTANSEKENPKRQRTSSGGKPYLQMVHEGILALKDRTGSSQPALAKWIQATYPEINGPQFKSRLNQALKTGVRTMRFSKVKSSFKISAAWKEQERNKKRQASKSRLPAKTAATKPTLSETKAQNAQTLLALKETMTLEELEEERLRMKKLEQSQRRAAAAERKAKERLERLRRRRFPMEDTKLHDEDKELNVKPPPDVMARPYLPYFWHLTRPLNDPSRLVKTQSSILTASKCDALDQGSNGLVSDLLQVYHFFRGDVAFRDDPEQPVVPDFTLQNLVYSVEQVLVGHTKSSRMIPPLLVHLFCTCLRILLSCPDPTTIPNLAERKLRKELHAYLLPALNPVSWSDVCFLYMDAMERFSMTDASRDPNVLPSLNIDIQYLLGMKDHPVVPMTPFVGNHGDSLNEEAVLPLPDGYAAYLGDTRGALYRAHFKLARSDPWVLSAEEIMALLRALTDDILATHPAISLDIGAREDEMQALLKAKRSADYKYRKVRVAFEGPKKGGGKKVMDDEAKKGQDDSKTDNSKVLAVNEEIPSGKEDNWKPTATRKQFDKAVKEQLKASESYEKGIRKLVARTEPIGYDRHFNAVYCFRHDPELLYVEELRAPSTISSLLPTDMQVPRRSWRVIETTSVFDSFLSSLDIRGKRENDLYEELLGPVGARQSLRRYLHDDLKENADAISQKKQMANLKERLIAARLKCDEEHGRRSGRLVTQAEDELAHVEKEIEELEKICKGPSQKEQSYEELTGLILLEKFDNKSGIKTRRSREKTAANRTSIPSLNASKIVSTGNVDGSGLVGILVAELFEVEEQCQTLSPWEKTGFDRATWISRFESAVLAWNDISPAWIAPPQTLSTNGYTRASPSTPQASPVPSGSLKRSAPRDSIGNDSERSSKRIRIQGQQSPSVSNGHSVQTIMTMIRQPLLELEERIADMTNFKAAASDADLADDNISISADDSDDDAASKERLERAWKKIIYKVSLTATRKHCQIRELVVQAIAAARKAHMPDVVSQLRAALLQYCTKAAGDCKLAAIKVLQDYGGYVKDDNTDNDDEEDDAVEKPTEKDDDGNQGIPSCVCAEAVTPISSLDGSADATRKDWIEDVKRCKTISRLASLTAGFVHQAKNKLDKIEGEHEALIEALSKWEKEADRTKKNKNKNHAKAERYFGPSEVWADVRIADEIVMAKAESYPWWPAKICVATDSTVAGALSNLNRSLVSLVGERGDLRVVRNNDINKFTGQPLDEDEEFEVPNDMRIQLEDCLAMARRIIRGKSRQLAGV